MKSLRKFLLLTAVPLLLLLNSCDRKGQQSWEVINIPGLNNYTIVSVDFSNNDKGMIVASLTGRSRIYRTTDGAQTWELSFEIDYGLHDIKIIGNENVIAVGNRGILRSTDFGIHWKKIGSISSEPLIAVDFSSSDIGLSVGKNGTILLTADGGNTWEKQVSGSTSFLNDVTFIDSNAAISVGSDATILHTDDGGKTWLSTETNFKENLTGVYFSDLQKGVAMGYYGTIFQSVDGGNTWQKRESHTGNSLLGVDFYGETGIIVGFGGTILKTVDAGRNWEFVKSGSDRGLYDVYMIDSEKVVIVGDKGTIMKNKIGFSQF
ncbi:MAG: YCF48-related protein [Balneolaceae bacterium]|nr:YCF48-related protein [Balneolaceae bacterium]